MPTVDGWYVILASFMAAIFLVGMLVMVHFADKFVKRIELLEEEIEFLEQVKSELAKKVAQLQNYIDERDKEKWRHGGRPESPRSSTIRSD